MGRISKIIGGAGAVVAAGALVVWGLLPSFAHEAKVDRGVLERQYAKAFTGAKQVKLLEAPVQSPHSGSAAIVLKTSDDKIGIAEKSLKGRDLDIHSIQYGIEECRRLVGAVAARCFVADAGAESPTSLIMNLEFATSVKEDEPSGTVDALRVEYTDRRPGDDAAGREDVYARMAAHCQGTRMTIGHCTITKIGLTTQFSVDDKGQRWSDTRGYADMLVVRNEASLND